MNETPRKSAWQNGHGTLGEQVGREEKRREEKRRKEGKENGKEKKRKGKLVTSQIIIV